MNQELVDKFLNSSSSSSSVDLLNYIIALSLSIIFSYSLKYVYVNYWRTIADKESISSNFVLLTLIITIIITVVKSSLALSLGLVGALSIVRFRTPIKDPEELIFLFICIAIGLSLGAFQFVYGFLGFIFVVLVILAKSFYNQEKKQNNFFLTINDNSFSVDDFLKKSSKYFDDLVLKKYEKNNKETEIIFNMKLKEHVKITDLNVFLKKNKIKNYTLFDQNNFFQN